VFFIYFYFLIHSNRSYRQPLDSPNCLHQYESGNLGLNLFNQVESIRDDGRLSWPHDSASFLETLFIVDIKRLTSDFSRKALAVIVIGKVSLYMEPGFGDTKF
jgi:hypothetical protein